MTYGIALLLFALVAGACSGSDDEASSLRATSGGDAAPGGAPALDAETADYGAPQPVPDQGDPAKAAALPSSGPHVIKTARLGIEVAEEDFGSAVQQAIGVAEARGGFVFSSTIKDEKHKRGTVVLRVPSGGFEAALKDAESIGDVTTQTVTGEDVGEEFVDLRSRLRNAQAQEEVLLHLYDRASTIAETIRIQREVEGVQLEIEQLQGRIRFLQDKTAMGTITIELAENGAPGTDPEVASTLGEAWTKAREAFVAVIAATVVVAGAVLPVALLLALALLVYRVLKARFSPSA
jgi:hypothetical protein